MSARYWSLVSDDLLAAGVIWPDGLRLVTADLSLPRPAGYPRVAGLHWHLFEDDEAPDDLNGRTVALNLVHGEDGRPAIAGREALLPYQDPP